MAAALVVRKNARREYLVGCLRNSRTSRSFSARRGAELMELSDDDDCDDQRELARLTNEDLAMQI
jgi:hypothetical protein